MSTLAGGAVPKVAPQVYDHIRALLRAGKNDEAIAKACAIAVIVPGDLIAKELLFDGFFQKRDWLPAHALAEELVRLQPDVPRLQKALIATLSNMKRYDETIAQAYHYIVRHGEDLTMLDALKVAYFYTGKIDEAVRYGQRALEIRDAEACADPPPGALIEPSRTAARAKRHLVLAVGQGAVLRLRRHDQSGDEPHRLSGLELPLLCRRRRAARLRRLFARQRRRRPRHRGRISGRRPVSTLPGDERSQRRTLPGARLRRAAVGGGSRIGAAMDRFRLPVPRDARPCAA